MKSLIIFLFIYKREMRGEPIFPNVLYCPVIPSVKLLFWNWYDMVSISLFIRSPKVSSNFQTNIPVGRSSSVSVESSSLAKCEPLSLSYPSIRFPRSSKTFWPIQDKKPTTHKRIIVRIFLIFCKDRNKKREYKQTKPRREIIKNYCIKPLRIVNRAYQI